MTFNRISILALLSVALLAVTVYGHPLTDVTDESIVKPIAEKIDFVRSWIEEIKTNVHQQKQNIKDGVVSWVKSKFGLPATSPDEEPKRTTPGNYLVSTEPAVDVHQNENTIIPNYGINYETTKDNYEPTEINSNVLYDYRL